MVQQKLDLPPLQAEVERVMVNRGQDDVVSEAMADTRWHCTEKLAGLKIRIFRVILKLIDIIESSLLVLNFLDILPLLPFVGKNIALFCGGLFAGATIYVSLTECPPRSVLGPRELMLLAYSIGSRTNALLLGLSALTTVSALLAALDGRWSLWMSGGLTHICATAFLLTNVRSVSKRLESLNPYEEEEAGGKLMQLRARQIAILALLGLTAQYQFILA